VVEGEEGNFLPLFFQEKLLVIIDENRIRGQVFDPKKHFWLGESPWLRTMRARIPIIHSTVPPESLFLFYHKWHRTFVLATWMPEGEPENPRLHFGIFRQVWAQPVSFEFSPPPRPVVEGLLEPALATWKRLRDSEAAKLTKRQRDLDRAYDLRTEMAGRHRKDLKDEMGARLIESGAIRLADGPEDD